MSQTTWRGGPDPLPIESPDSPKRAYAGILLASASAGVAVALSTSHFFTIAFGAPALLALVLPGSAVTSFVIIAFLAPLGSFVKAFTGLVYAPVILDIGTIVVAIVAITRYRVGRGMPLDRQVVLAGALMLLGFVQMFNPSGPGLLNASYSYRFWVLPVVGILIGYYIVGSSKNLRYVVNSIFAVSAIVALYAIVQSFGYNDFDRYIVQSSNASPITYALSGTQRSFSTMSGAFHLGHFMSAMILLMIAKIIVSGFHWYMLIALPMMFAAMILSLTRSSWFGCFAGMGVLLVSYLYLYRPRLTYVVRLCVIALVLATVFSVIAASRGDVGGFQRALASILSPTEDTNFQLRMQGWTTIILPALASNPFGHGLGSAATTAGARFTPDNGFLYIAIEIGILGLLIAVCLLIFGFYRSLLLARATKDPFVRVCALWTVALIAATCVQATTGPLLETYPINLYLWFLIGSVSSLLIEVRRRTGVAAGS